QPRRLTREAQHLHGAVLRPVPGARLDLAYGTCLLSVPKPQLRPDSCRVAGRTCDAHTQSRLCPDVVKQPGRGTILTHRKVQAAVSGVVRVPSATLLAVDDEPGLLASDRLQAACAVTVQQQAAARVIARRRHRRRKEILAEKQIFVAIAVEI